MYWTQQRELDFINSMGLFLPSSHYRSTDYPERCVRGYIESLEHRRTWWPGKVDVDELRTHAYRRLSEVSG